MFRIKIKNPQRPPLKKLDEGLLYIYIYIYVIMKTMCPPG